MNPIDPAGRVPVYLQIAGVLLERITDGTYPPGARLPSETALTVEFGASQVTNRRAVGVLVESGHAERVKGRGAYVAGPAAGERRAAGE